MRKIVRVFTVFSGYDSQVMALMLLAVKHPKFKFVLVGWCEIDENAIVSHNAVFPEYKNTRKKRFHFPDVSKIDWKEVPDFDLLFYSFCCQSLSLTGAMEGMEEGSGTESSLIWFVRKAIEVKKPEICILENVKNLISVTFMPSFIKWQRSVDMLGYRSVAHVLNAADFNVPQNRERVFMVSIRKDVDVRFKFPKSQELSCKIEEYLEKDIVDEKYYFSQDQVIKYLLSISSKQVHSISEMLNPEGGHMVRKMVSLTCQSTRKKKEAKAVIPTLKATGYDTFDYRNCYTSSHFCQPAILEIYENGDPIAIPDYKTIISEASYRKNDKGEIVSITNFSLEEIRNVLKNMKSGEYFKLRRMTPREMFRFMGVREYDIDKLVSSGVSDSELYKQAGNSIVVDVLYNLLEELFINNRLRISLRKKQILII